jgi:hypothetical protein
MFYKNYEEACWLPKSERSKLLIQLIGFHTLAAAGSDTETMKIVDELIGKELKDVKDGVLTNPEYDHPTMNSYKYFKTIHGDTEDAVVVPITEEWGSESPAIEEPVVVETTKSGATVNLNEVLGYATSAGITRLVNQTNPKLAKFKPYTEVSQDDAVVLLTTIQTAAPAPKQLLIRNYLEGLNA